jgi:cytochrome P450
VVFSVYVTQRDPRFFPDPLAFDPERFSPVRRGLIPKHAYLPFGAGSHVCIGNAFALMEARLILATLVSRFDFELGEGFVPRSRAVVTFGIEGGLPMRLSRRGVGVTPAGT